jgi:hypothetical protein
MGMKIVFIAGAYSAPTEWDVIQNIRASEDAAIQIWNLGVAAMCSNKNQAHLGGSAPNNVWLEGNLEFVRRSDAVFCVSGWEKSSGARAEVEAAQKAGIPLFSEMSA